MSADQAAAELTTRDVLQQVDRRLTLIEEDLRSLDEKLDDKVDGLRSEMTTQYDNLHSEMDRRLTLIEEDLRSLDEKLDDKVDGLRSEMTTQYGNLHSEMDRQLHLIEADLRALDAKFDAFHLATKQDILVVKQGFHELELRLKHDLTVRLGGMMVVGITLVATLVKLL